MDIVKVECITIGPELGIFIPKLDSLYQILSDARPVSSDCITQHSLVQYEMCFLGKQFDMLLNLLVYCVHCALAIYQWFYLLYACTCSGVIFIVYNGVLFPMLV